jgi:hypothetical protein
MNRQSDQSVVAIEARKSASRIRQTKRQKALCTLETESKYRVTRKQKNEYWDKYKQFDQEHPYEHKPCRISGCEGVALNLFDLQTDVASIIMRYCIVTGDTNNDMHALCKKCFPKFVSCPSGKFLREMEDEIFGA